MSTYKPAGLHVVHQNIVGEVIIVDLQAGSYFSLTESGTIIWESLVRGLTPDQIVAEAGCMFDGAAEEIEQSVASLVTQLLSEQLIVEVADSGQAHRPATDMSVPAQKLPFVRPILQKYTDMEDILVLDPIHDFDEAGLAPNVPKVTANTSIVQ